MEIWRSDPADSKGPDAVETASRGWRVFWSLLLVALLGAVIWVIYGFSAGGISLFGNCGPRDFLNFQEGHLVGGASASARTAAAIGGVLVAAAGAAVWRAPQRWRRVALAYVALYVAALLVLAFVVAPLVWGHQRCVIS
jgi:hypothetical protein